jgi:DNA-binding protein Fis
MALSQGNRSIAAKMLGVSRPTLLKKLKKAAEKRSDED